MLQPVLLQPPVLLCQKQAQTIEPFADDMTFFKDVVGEIFEVVKRSFVQEHQMANNSPTQEDQIHPMTASFVNDSIPQQYQGLPPLKAARRANLTQLWDASRIPSTSEYAVMRGTDGLKYLMVKDQAPFKGQPVWSIEKRMDFLQRINSYLAELIQHIPDPHARHELSAWVERAHREGVSSVHEHINDGGSEGYASYNEQHYILHGRMFIKCQQLGPRNNSLPDESLFALTYNLALHEMTHIIWGLGNHGPEFDAHMEELRTYSKNLQIPGF